MTQQFILDENVIILAHKQQDDHGVPDRACRNLLERIIDICHPIVVSPGMMEKYSEKVSALPKSSPDTSHVLATLASAWRRADKVDNQPDAVPFPEESAIHRYGWRDVEIVRLVVATGAILVTTDRRLLEGLETTGIRERYNLQVVSPDDALNLL